MTAVLSRTLVFALAFSAVAFGASEAPEPFSVRDVPVQPVLYQLEVAIDYVQRSLTGRAGITVKNPGTEPAGTVPFVLYRLLKVTSVLDSDETPIPFEQRVVAFEDFGRLQVNYLELNLAQPISPGEERKVVIAYEGYLEGASETGMSYVKDRISPEFTILRSDAFAFPCLGFPSFFALRKAGLPVFDWEARIDVPDTLNVANGGRLVEKTVDQGRASYRYASIKPSWRMDFAIGAYEVLEEAGVKVFHFAEDREGARSAARSFARAFRTFSDWFGPQHDFESFSILEVPEGYGGQADITCILQTADAFRDPSRAFLIYHEVSHLWNVPVTDTPSPRIEEGFAVFLQWLLTDLDEGKNGALLDEKLESIAAGLQDRFEEKPALKEISMIDYGRREVTDLAYRVGALMFAILHRNTSEQEFQAIFRDFYRDHWKSGASTQQFVDLAQLKTKADVSRIFHDWLFTTDFVKVLESGTSFDEMARSYR